MTWPAGVIFTLLISWVKWKGLNPINDFLSSSSFCFSSRQCQIFCVRSFLSFAPSSVVGANECHKLTLFSINKQLDSARMAPAVTLHAAWQSRCCFQLFHPCVVPCLSLSLTHILLHYPATNITTITPPTTLRYPLSSSFCTLPLWPTGCSLTLPSHRCFIFLTIFFPLVILRASSNENHFFFFLFF